MCAWGITETGDRALVGEVGRAGVQGGLARARPRPHRPRTRCTTPSRRRRCAGADLGGRGALASRGPSALRRSPLAQPPREGAEGRPRPDPLQLLVSAHRRDLGQGRQLRLQVLISELEHRGYESAARCLADDLDALVVHLRYPLRHREQWRSTNLLERSLGEIRRRTKVMGRFPGETSRLSLVWAVLDLFFSHASNGATFTEIDRQHLYRIKYRQADPNTLDEEVTAAETQPREPEPRANLQRSWDATAANASALFLARSKALRTTANAVVCGHTDRSAPERAQRRRCDRRRNADERTEASSARTAPRAHERSCACRPRRTIDDAGGGRRSLVAGSLHEEQPYARHWGRSGCRS